MSILYTWKYWLIAMAITALLSAGGGFYLGEQSIVKPYAQATTQAVDKGRAAQSKQDNKDQAANRVDSANRKDSDKKTDIAVAATKKTLAILIPPQPDCPPIRAIVMGRLNDPDIIGKDAQ
jgi:hypothetical protein